MATLTHSTAHAATTRADVLVLAVAKGKSAPVILGASVFEPALRKVLNTAIKAVDARTSPDALTRIPAPEGIKATSVALIGVGAEKSVGTEDLRRAAGSAIRQLAGAGTVALALPCDDLESFTAICEGALMGSYAFNTYRSGETTQAVARITVLGAAAGGAAAKRAAARASIVAQSVCAARDLINTAPCDLYPATFAEQAVAAVADLPIKTTVLDEKKLAKGGYGGLIGVGQGSVRPPRLVSLSYAPKGAVRHLALIGKGITFDSGGISIKPAAGMDAMKSDMSGAAAVLQAISAIAQLKLPVRVTAWMALAENMPSGTASRPSDVLTIRGGKTVEVLNTDAEGRLVLADALVAAGEENPDLIVDVATLTGAQMVALGNRVSAIMSNRDELATHVHAVATAAGEQFWPMPLPGELRSSMDSRVADIANIGDRFGGMLVAGLFLKEFVPTSAESGEQTPWVHLDIAGPAFNTGSAHGYTPVGGTGVAVRLLISLAEDLVANPDTTS